MENEIDVKLVFGLVFLTVFLWFLFHKAGGVPIPIGIFVSFCFISFLVIPLWVCSLISRNSCQRVTADGFQGSFIDTPELITAWGIVWAIYKTGAFKSPWYESGKGPVLIVPYSQLNVAGLNHNYKTRVQKVPYRVLFRQLRHFLFNNEYNMKHIYFGFVSSEFVHQNPKFQDVENQIKSLNDYITFLEKISEGKNDKLWEEDDFKKKVVNKIFAPKKVNEVEVKG